MKVFFRTIAEGTKVEFTTETLDDTLYFKDESIPNTYISIVPNKNGLAIYRTGAVKQNLIFDLNKITDSHYENKDGFSFDFKIRTLILHQALNSYYLKYELIKDNEVISTHKIWIKYESVN